VREEERKELLMDSKETVSNQEVYEAPRVEKVLGPQELAREVHYAGGPSIPTDTLSQ
jgi:hypothetical protein